MGTVFCLPRHPAVAQMKVSVQYVDNQEGISEGTFEEDNIFIEPTVKLSVQCMANQRGLHGQILYDDVSYPICLQPQAEPDIDDEGITVDMEKDEGQELY